MSPPKAPLLSQQVVEEPASAEPESIKARLIAKMQSPDDVVERIVL